MPSLTIDGQTFEFDGKKTILQVALDNGVEIPHYCYHEGLSVVASCRICLAEVAAPNPRNDNKVELIPKLVPTCQTPAADGQVVHTQSPKSIANQKAVMEYLLINHPLDCPVCDQAGECYLQDYSYKYGRSESRFLEDKIKQPTKDIGPNVKLYADRCIMCSRCVRFTKEVTGTNEIGVFGRGSKEQIDVFPGNPLDNELSANVVDICPVGALLDKDFLFTQRVWFLKHYPSIDGITASGDNLFIFQNNDEIYRVKPRKNLEVNLWWTSDEIRYGWKFVHSDKRLRMSAKVQFNDKVELDWTKAYEQVRKGFKQVVEDKGEGSLAALISPMLASEEAYLLCKTIRAMDPEATIAMGPVPIEGEDKTFPGGYTVYAEKCPNRRGVERAIKLVTGEDGVPDFEAFIEQISDKKTKTAGMLLTGNYPSDWAPKELTSALRNKFTVLIDTLDSGLAAKADVVLPGATWTEKQGSFENITGRHQAFFPAIAPIEFVKAEGQIAIDLHAAFVDERTERYVAASVRDQMGGPFATDVHMPPSEDALELDMEYVEL